MKARFFSLVLLTVSMLVGCTEVNDPVLDQVVNQNEENIVQLKAMAEDAGWVVSPKILESARTTPLTKAEIAQLQEDLDIYSLFLETSEKREMEVVPFVNQYVFLPMFVPRVETKAITGGSMYVLAEYGYCFSNVCNQIHIRVTYDLDERGDVVYAFGGAGNDLSDGLYCTNCGRTVVYGTLYSKCEWNAHEIFLKLWLRRIEDDGIGSKRVYLYSEGPVNVKTGDYHFYTHEISKNELPPEILNPTSLQTIK